MLLARSNCVAREDSVSFVGKQWRDKGGKAEVEREKWKGSNKWKPNCSAVSLRPKWLDWPLRPRAERNNKTRGDKEIYNNLFHSFGSLAL